MNSNDRKINNNKEIVNIINNRRQVSIREGYFSKYPCSFCYFIFGLFGYTLAFIASEHTINYIIIFSCVKKAQFTAFFITNKY